MDRGDEFVRPPGDAPLRRWQRFVDDVGLFLAPRCVAPPRPGSGWPHQVFVDLGELGFIPARPGADLRIARLATTTKFHVELADRAFAAAERRPAPSAE